MCSLQPESWDIKDRDLQASPKGFKGCVKCHNEAAPVQLRDASYCDDCFIQVFSHKVRQCLGKAFHENANNNNSGKDVIKKAGRRMEFESKQKILLVFSGSLKAMTLMHAVTFPFVACPNRPCPFEFQALYIGPLDDSIALEMTALMKSYNIPLTILPLTAVYSPSSPTCSSISTTKDMQPVLEALFASLPNETMRESVQKLFELELIFLHAASSGFTNIYVDDDKQDSASALLSSIALGRGFSLPIEGAPCVPISYPLSASASVALKLIKPLRDIMPIEIEHYARIYGLSSLPSFKERVIGTKCIQGCTSSFLASLQHTFPSTVSNVTNTASKVATAAQTSKKNPPNTCSLCLLPAEDGVTAWRHRITVANLADTPAVQPHAPAVTLCFSCEYCRPFLDSFPPIFSRK